MYDVTKLPMTPAPVGGLLNFNFDYKQFCGDADTTAGIEKIAASGIRASSFPFNSQTMIINGLVKEIEALLAMAAGGTVLPAPVPHGPGGIIVGAEAPMTTHDAVSYSQAIQASQGIVLGTDVLAKLQANPDVVRLLKTKSEKQQAKILTTPGWLDKIIGWLVTYGPMIAKILMMLLPLL